MKTLAELKKQKPVYLEIWNDKDDVMKDFEQLNYSLQSVNKNILERWKKIKILFAFYEYADYSGNAWVLFLQDGKLYEVNGGHCSCYGLEGQWDPEPTTLKDIAFRIKNGNWGYAWRSDLVDFLDIK
jgi:hypothetical protein